MSAITWAEPPTDVPVKRREPKYLDIAAELRAHEGEWALIFEDAWATMANQIKNGGLAAFRPRGEFEARAVPLEGTPTRAQIYARYVGKITSVPATEVAESPKLTSEAAIRADERARIADELDAARDQTWTGGERKPNNFGRAAEFVRNLLPAKGYGGGA